MANIEKIKRGQVLHDYHKYRIGNVNARRMGHWPIIVTSVDLNARTALCSWNNNPARRYSEKDLKRLLVKEKADFKAKW